MSVSFLISLLNVLISVLLTDSLDHTSEDNRYCINYQALTFEPQNHRLTLRLSEMEDSELGTVVLYIFNGNWDLVWYMQKLSQ